MKIQIPQYFLILLLFCQCNPYKLSYQTHQKWCGHQVSSCSNYFYDFESLPAHIQKKATTEILNYLNKEDVEKEITFVKYQLIDTIDCQTITNYQWEVPEYRLHYLWEVTTKDIDHYCFVIALNKKAELLAPIELPNTLAAEEHKHFISTKQVDSIAKIHKFQSYEYYELMYDTSEQVLIWYLSKNIQSFKLNKSNDFFINAHNGKIMNMFE